MDIYTSVLWLLAVYISPCQLDSGHSEPSPGRVRGSGVVRVAALLALTDIRGDLPPSEGVRPAIKLAIRHINKNKHILKDYRLSVLVRDSQCDMAVGTKLFFDMMHDDPPKVMLFGDACSHVTAPIAESAIWWKIWQLSYADTNPILSDRSAYPNFFRTVPSDSDYNPARIELLRMFKWKRVGTLFQDASRGSSRHAYSHSLLTELLDKEKIHRQTESFSSDPKPALTNLKQKDIRIIIGNFDHEMARKVFCSAHEQQMFGPKYVWIVPGDYPDAWWREADTNITCKPQHLREALEGYIGSDVMPLSLTGGTTIAGITSAQYQQLYDAQRGDEYNKFHGYAYDGIWVIAKAVDTIIRQNGGRFDMKDFRGERLPAALNETNFMGATGKIVFHKGDRVGCLVIKQFQNAEMVDIGEYDAHTNSLNLSYGQSIIWRGKGPPRDRTLQSKHIHRVNKTITAVMATFALLGMVMALCFLALNIKYRKHRYIKMSSPNLNNIIIVGCLFTYFSVLTLGADGSKLSAESFPYMCAMRTWVLCIGFTLSFGAMFSKTWRVHAIFTNIKLNRKVIKDYQLFMIVLVLLAVDIIVLVTWSVLDPMVRDTKELPPEADPSGNDVEVIKVLEFCVSRDMMYYLITVYAYKGCLLMAGCFLAWETRQVTIPALNDSKYIGMSVYNVVIMCVSGVPVSFIMKDSPDASFLIISLFILFSTTITLVLVFMPKLVELRRDPIGNDKRIRATLRKTSKRDENGSDLQLKIRQLSEENFRFRQILEEKKREIRDLYIQLGQEGLIPDGVKKSPGRRQVTITDNNFLSPARTEAQLGLPCCSDDDMSFISTSSGTNLWPASTTITNVESENTLKEDIELSSLRHIPPHFERRSRHVTCDDTQVEEDLADVESPLVADDMRSDVEPPAYDDLYSRNRRFSSSASRTPSYQGLKFLNDIFSLRETAILSDSDHDRSRSNSPSIRSLPVLRVTEVDLSSNGTEGDALLPDRKTVSVDNARRAHSETISSCDDDPFITDKDHECICTLHQDLGRPDNIERLIDFKPSATEIIRPNPHSESQITRRAKNMAIRLKMPRSEDRQRLLPVTALKSPDGNEGTPLSRVTKTDPVQVDVVEYI